MPGKGSFAALPMDVNAGRREELLAKFDGIAQELKYLGMTAEELAARVMNGKEDEKDD